MTDPAPGRVAASTASVLLAAALVAGCAAGRAGGEDPGDAPAPEDEPAPEAPAPERPSPASLDGVRSLLSTDPGRALHAADSLYFALRADGGSDLAADALRLQARAAAATGDTAGAIARLRELLVVYPESDPAGDAALPLARMLRARTDDPGAAEALLRHGGAGAEEKAVLRSAAGAMSVAELEAAEPLAGRDGVDPSVRALVRAELAEARARAGRLEAARRTARAALASEPDPPDRRTARSVLEGTVSPASGPVRVGVLLPDSGRYASVSRWIRQGLQIALEGDGGRGVELVARDLSAGPVGELVEELEDEGVAAVLGPIRAGRLTAAARARANPGLLVVSPTAMRSPPGPLHAYALRDRRRGELDAAAALGRWVGAEVRPGPVGALYPRGELGRRSFLRFRRGLGEAGGGWIVASASYDPEATTLQAPVTEVSAYRPEAVYAGAEGTSSLLQMAPQLAYYGVRAALVVGGPDWTRPGAVRRLDPAFTQLRVGATFAPGEGEETARSRFRASYEMRYRTTLGDNMLPVLGHDAALLVRRAAAATSPPRPRAVARAFGGLSAVEGATGTLWPQPTSGTVRRRVRLRALEDRRLRPIGAAEAREWLRAAGRLVSAGARGRRARARRAVRQSEIPLTGARTGAEQGGEEPR